MSNKLHSLKLRNFSAQNLTIFNKTPYLCSPFAKTTIDFNLRSYFLFFN